MATLDPEATISVQGFEALLTSLLEGGYTLIGPALRQGAITYTEIHGVSDLPLGVTEVQQAGSYRLEHTGEQSLFRFASTAQSFKRYFHPPEVRLFSLRKGPDGPSLLSPSVPNSKLALIGARGCDIAALGVLDGVLGTEPHADPNYVRLRSDVIVIAVNCAVPGGTCFCLSAGTGPRVTEHFDLALTEVSDEGEHRFVVSVGSEGGRRLLSGIATEDVSPRQLDAAEAQSQACEAALRAQSPDLSRVHPALQRNAEHPRWQDVADRCLSCGNCTAVCPTCFCTDRVEHPDAEGQTGQSELWDSCFTSDFSHLHGGAVRSSTRARYRQWLTHKFSTWFDQFGNSGCVGCGRCITWCPVGIDVRQELAVLGQWARPRPPSTGGESAGGETEGKGDGAREGQTLP